MYMQASCILSTGIGLHIKYLLFLAVFLSLFFIGGCNSKYNSYDILVEYQVPFTESRPRWNEVDLIEEDEYGRKIFSYKSVGSHTNVLHDYMGADYNNAPVLVYIITQKTDKKFIYCYDDICYAYVKTFGDNDRTIAEFKKSNDWGEPINDEKLTALSINICCDKIMKYLVMSIEETAVTTLSDMANYEIDDYYIDAIFLEDATPIFVLREVINREKHEFGKSFVFHIPDDSSKATYLELSDDIQNWNEEIHNFKATLKAEETDAVNE